MKSRVSDLKPTARHVRMRQQNNRQTEVREISSQLADYCEAAEEHRALQASAYWLGEWLSPCCRDACCTYAAYALQRAHHYRKKWRTFQHDLW